MKFDLRKPCRNCPFRTDGQPIRFASRERTEEIEEQAYRHGFPCHLSAELIENDNDSDGYVAGPNTQHCAGAARMYLNGGDGRPWPGIDNDEELFSKLEKQLDWRLPVFESVEAFLDGAVEKHRRGRR